MYQTPLDPTINRTVAQIARDFGVNEMTLHTWMRQTAIDEGDRPGKPPDESA